MKKSKNIFYIFVSFVLVLAFCVPIFMNNINNNVVHADSEQSTFYGFTGNVISVPTLVITGNDSTLVNGYFKLDYQLNESGVPTIYLNYGYYPNTYSETSYSSYAFNFGTGQPQMSLSLPINFISTASIRNQLGGYTSFTDYVYSARDGYSSKTFNLYYSFGIFSEANDPFDSLTDLYSPLYRCFITSFASVSNYYWGGSLSLLSFLGKPYRCYSVTYHLTSGVKIYFATMVPSNFTPNNREYFFDATPTSDEYYNLGYQSGYETGYYNGERTGQQSGYETGYTAGQSDGYSAGEIAGQQSGYSSGYNAGNTVGYNTGYYDGIADSNEYTFTGLMGAVIDAPVTVFSSLFNFNLLGVNLLAFITGLFTLAVIVFVLKLLLGGK